MSNYEWRSIEPLSDKDRSIDLAAMHPLYESWRAAREGLKKSSPENLLKFTQRLVRRLSVETGILERLYDLDRGTTEALVTYGFSEDLILHSGMDVEPAHLIDLLRDQEAAIQLVMDCAYEKRDLTKGLIHELHSILTRHQESTNAIDQFGNRREIPLLRGAFKEHPNNPRRPDGSLHEYCPPLQVGPETDRLLALLEEYENEDPIIVASWLHHRFTQIHPYQDGNGRVARALRTLILLKEDLLPFVVDRDLKAQYIDALEAADAGDLTVLAVLFARLEREVILQALSVDVDAEISRDRTLTTAVIESLAARFSKRREEKYAEFRHVNVLAESLRARTRAFLEVAISALKDPISEIGPPVIHMTEGGPDRGNAHWYKYEVVESGRVSGKYVNFDEAHYFLKASIRVNRERLVFVTSFHHVGRELSGIMEGTAFARLESFEDSDDRDYVSRDFFPCSLEPFVITWLTNEDEIAASYSKWLDASLAVALKEFGDRL